MLGDDLNELTNNAGACSFAEPLYGEILKRIIKEYIHFMKRERPDVC